LVISSYEWLLVIHCFHQPLNVNIPNILCEGSENIICMVVTMKNAMWLLQELMIRTKVSPPLSGGQELVS
jgi:hypothetical protein